MNSIKSTIMYLFLKLPKAQRIIALPENSLFLIKAPFLSITNLLEITDNIERNSNATITPDVKWSFMKAFYENKEDADSDWHFTKKVYKYFCEDRTIGVPINSEIIVELPKSQVLFPIQVIDTDMLYRKEYALNTNGSEIIKAFKQGNSLPDVKVEWGHQYFRNNNTLYDNREDLLEDLKFVEQTICDKWCCNKYE